MMKLEYKGFLAVIVSGFVFGSMPLLVKYIYASGGNAINLVFWRFFIAVPVLYAILKIKKDISIKITKEECKQLILVSIGYVATAMLLFISYNYIPTGIATTLHFTYPVFVILSCILFYKEAIDPIKALGVILCSMGILALYNGDAEGSVFGIFLAFSSGVTYAFYMVYLDKSGLKSMYSIKLTFYLSIMASAIMLVITIMTGTFTLDITPSGWLITSILAIVVSLGAVNLLSVGINIVGSQSASILSTFEPITSVVIGILVLRESLDFRTIIGCMLILTSVILVVAFDRANKTENTHLNAAIKVSNSNR